MSDKLWYLEKLNLFSKMTDKEKKHMSDITVMTENEKYTPIFLPGDAAKHIYIIKTGKVKISKISPDGKQLTLSILNPGDIFGEIALFDEDEYNTIAEAIESTYLCAIKKNDFEELLKTKPELHFKVTKLIGLRLKNIQSKVEDLVFKDVLARLISLLVNLAKSYSKETSEGIEINMRLTHEDISHLIAVNRQTATEKLNELKQMGLVKLKRAKVIINDLSKLEDLLNTYQ